MGDSEERDSEIWMGQPCAEEGGGRTGGMVVESLFDRKGDGRGALVEDGILRILSVSISTRVGATNLGTVVEQSRHGHSLLITARECVSPFSLRLPPALTLDNVVNLEDRENLHQVLVRDSARDHGGVRVRVDDLVPERAEGEVRALGDVRELRRRRLGHRSTCTASVLPCEHGGADRTVYRPEPAEDAEEGALAGPVATDDEEVLSRLDVERERLDQNIAWYTHQL